MISEAATVDNYISEAPAKRIEALQKIRELCLKYLPKHKESMSYKMPSYKLANKVQVAFASQKQHICVYFLIHSVMLNKSERLKGFNHGKGCLRFSNPAKIDFNLITELLKETAQSKDKAC